MGLTEPYFQAPGALPTKATIQASSGVGGLLSAGTWSTQTLATYTISGTTSSFTMTSSKGNCGVSGTTFSCGSGVTATTFSAVRRSAFTAFKLRYIINTWFVCRVGGIWKQPPPRLWRIDSIQQRWNSQWFHCLHRLHRIQPHQ